MALVEYLSITSIETNLSRDLGCIKTNPRLKYETLR